MPSQIVIDPDAELDLAFDWGVTGVPKPWLAEGETIVSFTVVCEDGNITVSNTSQANGIVTWWASEGVVGTDAMVTNHIVTSEGREDDRSMRLMVRQR